MSSIRIENLEFDSFPLVHRCSWRGDGPTLSAVLFGTSR